MYTIVIGIKRMIAGGDAATEWNLVMATAMLAMLPPALVVLLMQKWFVKGLVDTEKCTMHVAGRSAFANDRPRSNSASVRKSYGAQRSR